MEEALTKPRNVTHTLYKLYNWLQMGIIDLNPEFQRAIKQSHLVDSVLNNFYVPPVIFSCKKLDNKRWIRVCIDGKQRLTAIKKFMEGEIPHVSPSDGNVAKRYYKNVNGKKTLSEPERELFDCSELLCVEYYDLSLQQEQEIFSRVQLGVALTPAEKLQAISSPMADFAHSIFSKYPSISLIMDTKRARPFQLITQSLHMIENEPEKFNATPAVITKFLKEERQVPSNLKIIAERIYQTLEAMIADNSDVFHKDNRLAPVEFVFLTYMIAKYPGLLISHYQSRLLAMKKHKIQGISIEIENVEVMLEANFNNNNNNSNDTSNTNPTATSLHNTPVITNAASKTSLTSSASSSSSMIAGEGITVTKVIGQINKSEKTFADIKDLMILHQNNLQMIREGKSANAIRDKLDIIKGKMRCQGTKTDASIQELDAHMADSLKRLNNFESDYQHLIAWIKEIKIWFKEAEYDFDKLELEVEKFDAEGMTGLRACVKSIMCANTSSNPSTNTNSSNGSSNRNNNTNSQINEAISNDLTALALRVDWECRWEQPIGIRDDDGWFINANQPNQKDVLIELESINQHVISFENDNKFFAATLRNFRVYSSGLIEKKFIIRVEEFNKHIEQAWSNIGEKVIYPDHSDHDQNENHLVKKGVYAYHRKMEGLKFKVNKAMKDYQDALRLLEKELQQKSDDLFNDTFNQNKRPILMSMSELRI
ncbi:10232_t:CDS:10 [Entrophospora sp. SA101]|nr:10232_t:CDS:10 [Entrophospora sp. SA101]